MKHLIAAALAAFALVPSAQQVSAQDSFIGQIILFAGSTCPRGFAPAEGQLLPISDNTAAFSILRNTFGGDGQTTFALPDLRAAAALGVGEATATNGMAWGQKVTLNGDAGETNFGGLGLTYCIALQGLFPG